MFLWPIVLCVLRVLCSGSSPCPSPSPHAGARGTVCGDHTVVGVGVSAGLVGQPCAATASCPRRVQSHAVLDTTLTGCGMGPDLRLLRSGGGAAETDFNGALGAAETDLNGMVPRSRSLSRLCGDAGVVAGEVCLSQDRGQVVPRDVAVLADLEGDCVRRRKAGLDLVSIREFIGHSHLLSHVHVCLRVVCLVLVVSVLPLLL